MNKNIALLALTGILTLASCGQNSDTKTVDTTAPTVTLTASPTSLTNAGGNVTLSGTATDTSGIASISITRNDGTAICSTTPDSNGAFSCPTSLGSNSTTSAVNYTFTATATDKAATPNKATASASVSVAASSNTTPVTPVTPSATVTITTPSNGDSAALNTPLTVKFTSSVALDSATCSVNGSGTTAATVSTSGGYCVVTPTAAGSNTITVTGVKAGYTVNPASVSVQTPAASTSPYTFDPAQQLVPNANGTVPVQANGWRRFGQAVSTPSDPAATATYDTYVKGTVNLQYTIPAGTTEFEVFLARTTGSDVPTADDIQAADKLNAVVNPTAGSVVTTPIDSTRLAEFEGVREWVIVRLNNTQLVYIPVVADNTAPQAAAPSITGASDTSSRLLRDVTYKNDNWARGSIIASTTNTSLHDLPDGVAPTGASTAQRRASGLQSIQYVLVPDSDIAGNNALTDSNLVKRAAVLRSGLDGAIFSGNVLSTANSATYASMFTSGAGNAQGIKDGVLYRVYAITTDKMGNEVASPSYDQITFDNVGPVISGSAKLCDDSPLPFPSVNPCKYISDYAAFTSTTTITDTGVDAGKTYSQPVFTIAGNTLTSGTRFDTNKIADGLQTVNVSVLNANGTPLTDSLGNPATGNVTTQQVIIDNTDPTVNFNRPTAMGTVTSGETVTAESGASDATSGIYQTLLFWDDSTGVNSVGHPVEFNRVTSSNKDTAFPVADGSNAVTNNAGWQALTVPGQNNTVTLRALVIDRAGNASLASTQVVVKPKNTLGSLPSIGQYDAYKYNVAEQLAAYDAANKIKPVGANGTTISPRLTVANFDNSLSLSSNGTGTTNGIPGTITSPTALTEKLNGVTAYGQFDANDWSRVQGYLTTPDQTGVSGDPSLIYNSPTQANRNLQWGGVTTPWLKMGETMTAPASGMYTFTGDLLNNLYWGRGYDTSVYGSAFNQPLTATYDQLNGIVTDTAGAYDFYGEKVQK